MKKLVPTSKAGFHPQSCLICVWCNMKSVVHYELMGRGRTITRDFYWHQLCWNDEILRWKSAVFGKQKQRYSPALQCKGTLCKRKPRKKLRSSKWTPFNFLYTHQIYRLHIFSEDIENNLSDVFFVFCFFEKNTNFFKLRIKMCLLDYNRWKWDDYIFYRIWIDLAYICVG